MGAERIRIRPIEEYDRRWIAEATVAAWGSDRVVSRGRLTENLSASPGLVAEQDGEPAGFALVRVEAGELEVVALRSLREREGVGSALLSTLEAEARRAGCRRVWLVTTNDNLDAIRFYQRRGWRWVAFHRDAVIESRKLKPEIPELGAYGIPIRHELEFEAPTS
jgi:ribosomal protein S18 acetylase RimI-like enzyme